MSCMKISTSKIIHMSRNQIQTKALHENLEVRKMLIAVKSFVFDSTSNLGFQIQVRNSTKTSDWGWFDVQRSISPQVWVCEVQFEVEANQAETQIAKSNRFQCESTEPGHNCEDSNKLRIDLFCNSEITTWTTTSIRNFCLWYWKWKLISQLLGPLQQNLRFSKCFDLEKNRDELEIWDFQVLWRNLFSSRTQLWFQREKLVRNTRNKIVMASDCDYQI